MLSEKHKDLFAELGKKDLESLQQGFAQQSHMTETEREIAINDQKNAYNIRKSWILNLEKFLDDFSSVVRVVLWCCALYIICITGVYLFHISGEEKKLYDIISNIFHDMLVGMSALYINHIKKKI